MQSAIIERDINLVNFEQTEMLSGNEGALCLLSDGKTTAIFYQNFCYGSFSIDDKFSRNFYLSQLHLSGGFMIKNLSKVFDLQYQHCSRIITAYKKNGFEGIRMDGPSGEGGRKLRITVKVGVEILRLRLEGKSYEDISRIIRFRFKKRIKVSTLATWVCNEKKKQKGTATPVEQAELPIDQERVESNLPVKSEEELVNIERAKAGWNSYAGSMILYSMIEKSNFLSAFLKNTKGSEKSSGAGGVERVLLTLFFLQALRCRSIEQGKHLVGRDFEEIVGGDFLRLQWLRYAIDEIVSCDGFEDVMADQYKNMILATSQGDKLFYTDGHFSTYYGKRQVPKGYDPRRQMPYRGRNTIYLHNSRGENVFLFESPTNTSLSNDIEVLVKSMREFGMELKGQTMCFDRGGFGQKCFRFLRGEKMYFISYLKHRKNERLVDLDKFEVQIIEREIGVPMTLRFFEKETKSTKYGNVRTIILLSNNGKQIPILTTNPYLKAVDVILILKHRWREENCFKYMIENFGIDLLTTYKTEEAPDKVIERPHPDRRAVNQELAEKKHELEKYKSEFATRISARGEGSGETIKEFYERERELNFKIKNVQVDIDYLVRKRKSIPTKEKRNLKDDHVIMAQKRRLFINMVKATNYNVEKWLQEIFEKYHDKKDETLSLIRNLCRQPGRVLQASGAVRVELTPLDNGPMRESLDKVLKNLKDNNWLKLPDGRNLEIIQTH